MLWSVVVCDLLHKLDDLRAKGDQTAVRISTDLEKKRTENPRSPEWEDWLVEEIRKTTHLLDITEQQKLATLHSDRHLCAHPVLTGTTYELFRPNKEPPCWGGRARMSCR